MATTVNVSVSGSTVTAVVDGYFASPQSAAINTTPPITPTSTSAPETTTYTFSGVPDGSFTVTVTCGLDKFTSPVTVASTGGTGGGGNL